jgi:Pyridoxamine 5'-phosphate oxidase
VDREIARVLLEAPSAAVLAVYRANGTVLMSPVWFRADDEWIEIVIAEGDAKLERLRVDPRGVFMAFETTPPFRGLRVEAEATLSAEGVRAARLAIASRYLGAQKGQQYVEQRTKPGVVVRLPLSSARTWDLQPILPT